MSNKWRYWLGLRALCKHRDAYIWTRRNLGIFRAYYDGSDGNWWLSPYSGSYFNTPEQARKALDNHKLVPV